MRAARLHVTLTVVLTLLLIGAPVAGQQAQRPFRVGVLHPAFFPSTPPVEALRNGLKSLGLEEGRDVTYEVRFTRGKSEATAPEAAALVKAGVDVIFAVTEEVTVAVKRATSTIPIVPAYDAMVTDEKSPIYRYAKRAYFIIDKGGVMRYVRVQTNPLDLLDSEQVLNALKAAGV